MHIRALWLVLVASGCLCTQYSVLRIQYFGGSGTAGTWVRMEDRHVALKAQSAVNATWRRLASLPFSGSTGGCTQTPRAPTSPAGAYTR